MPHPNTLTTTEAAIQLDCSGETVRRMIKTGALPAHRLTTSPKSAWRIYAADLNLLEQRRATWYDRFEIPPDPNANLTTRNIYDTVATLEPATR